MTFTNNFLRAAPAPAPLPVDGEKGSIATELPISHGRREQSRRNITQSFFNSEKMPSFRQFLATFILGALLTLAFASAASHPHCASKTQSKDDVKFKELLSSVSNDALHEVLHDVWKKYKHGVYPEDRTAMEAVHQDNAEMATVLIELAKRQSVTNGTTTTSTSTTSTAVTTGTTITTTQRPTTVTGPTTITSTPTTPVSIPLLTFSFHIILPLVLLSQQAPCC
jgi:hypothetical protein